MYNNYLNICFFQVLIVGTYLKSVGVPMSCLVSFALPFFPFSFVLFLVGVVPLPTANGRDGALTPKISELNIISRLLFCKKIWNKKLGVFLRFKQANHVLETLIC